MRTFCLFLLAAAAAAGPDLVELRRQKILEAFFRAVEARTDLDAEAKRRILAMREGAVLEGEYGVIHQSLLLVSSEYRRGDALLQNDRFAAASEVFERLSTAEDPYLRAYALYRYGLCELNREHYGKAAESFSRVLNEHSKEAGCDVEAAYYRAVALAQARDKENALVAAKRFLEDYPDAPERYRKAAEQLIHELLQQWESPLYDLSGRMQHAAGSIEGGDTGEKVQKEQKEILSVIEELLKRRENQENQGDGGGGGGGQGDPGKDPSNSPLNRSKLPGGSAEEGSLHAKPKSTDKWGDMRDKEREEVLQAFKDKLPDRYRELLEQYSKTLAEGKRVGEGQEPQEDK